MKPLITKAQGRACRKAAEYIEWGKWDGDRIYGLPGRDEVNFSFFAIGCALGKDDYFTTAFPYDQSEVLTALLWCAEIAGEA